MRYLLLLLLIPTLLRAEPWPNSMIPYTFTDIPNRGKAIFIKAIKEWNRKVPFLRFINVDQKADVRVSVQWSESETCVATEGYNGYYHYVTLSDRCDYAITLHEIGHIIGLYHEHNRRDRDKYIKIDLKLVPSEYHNQYDVEFSKPFGPYDYLSIMHYGVYVIPGQYNESSVPVIERLDGFVGPPYPEHLRYITEEDVREVYHLYVKKRN